MIIDGKKIAEEIQEEIKEKIERIQTRPPCLAVLIVGEHPASQIYVKRKIQACAHVGIRSIKKELPTQTTEETLLEEIARLNEDPSVDGILVQLPLPPQINPLSVTRAILPEKDVDGFHPYNVGKLLIGDPSGFIPCTPLGIKTLLERYRVEIAGKHVVVCGRSNTVGKPTAALLMQNSPSGNATVTIAHRFSQGLPSLCRLADILIVAIGSPLFVQADWIKEGATVIDVGINKIPAPESSKGYRLVGDVDFVQAQSKCAFITPAPGGVGPMTIAMLLSNTQQSFLRRNVV